MVKRCTRLLELMFLRRTLCLIKVNVEKGDKGSLFENLLLVG